MSGFSFPTLADAELVPCLEEMEVPLTAAQLAKPTYELVRPVYESIVTTLTGVTREELQQPVFTAIDTLQFPELHDESISTMAFFKALTKLMAAAGVKDFSFKDLYKPEPARLRRNLSAVVNFAKFREEKLGPYADMQEQAEALLEEKEELEAMHARLAEEFRVLQEARSAEEPAVAALEAEVQAVYFENQQLNKSQAALNTEVRVLKQQTNSLADEAADAKFKLLTAQQEGDRLQSQIVESPEKLNATLEAISTAVVKERQMVTDAERQTRDLQSRLDAIAKVEKDVAKLMGSMEEVEGELARKKELGRKVKVLRAEIAGHEREALQLASQQQHLQRQQATLLERLQRLETQGAPVGLQFDFMYQQASLRKEAAASSVEEKLKDKEALEAENAAIEAKIAENDAAILRLQEKTSEVESSHSRETVAILEQYNLLQAAVQDYHCRMEAAMQGVEVA